MNTIFFKFVLASTRGRRDTVGHWNAQGLFLIAFPASMVACFSAVCFGIFILTTSKPVQLLYTILPMTYQREDIFYVLLALEFLLYNFGFGLCCLTVYIQLSFFQAFTGLINSGKFE